MLLKSIVKSSFLVSATFCLLFIGKICLSLGLEQENLIPSITGNAESAIEDESVVIAGGATWRDPSIEDRGGESSNNLVGSFEQKSAEASIGPKTTRYSYELSPLPNQDGQFWIVYDISPYSERFPSSSEPQKSIVEWIKFDSGVDFWQKEPFCVLSASRERLYVYHNADVQRYVSNIVDRFIDPAKSVFSFSIQVIAVQSPEWRLRAVQYLTPTTVAVEGNGADVQGWIVERENMTKIITELEKRSDYIALNNTKKSVPNGQMFGWASAAPRKTFARDYRVDSKAASGYIADTASVDEGYRIEATPLLSTTGETLETTFRYSATVVERMKTFNMRVPTTVAPRQQLQVERPQIVSCEIMGKISLPSAKSAIIDLGMVPLTGIKKESESTSLVDSVSNIVSTRSAFYDVLILIDSAAE